MTWAPESREAAAGPAAADTFVFPATFAQRRLWFLDRLGSGTAYSIAHAGSFRLRGRLDVNALRRALDGLVLRHESLRTTFRELDGEPVQVVASSGSADLEIVDLTAIPRSQRDRETLRLARDTVERRFDLSTGPLFRARLVRLEDDEQVLLLTLHHVIADGWSMGVLYRDLSALYAAALLGRPSDLEELRVQLADIAVWERERLSGERLRGLLEYWRRQLADPPDLRLPADRPAAEAASADGARVPLDRPRDLTVRLNALGLAEGATLFMTTLAGFFGLLHRQTGACDLLVGAPIAHRLRREMEGLIGFFVNTLAIRVDCSGDPTFRALIGRVRDTCLAAYEHQELPFERLVEELRPERAAGRQPLFQIVFALQDFPSPTFELSGLTIEPYTFDRTTIRYDLECHIRTREGRLSGDLVYAVDRFEPAGIERLARGYLRLLAAAVAEPDLPLSQLPLLDDDERRLLLVEWNGAVTGYPRDRTLHGLFAERAREHPRAEALRSHEGSVSYSELDERTNRLARRLTALGVEPNAPVGVCLERSIDAIAAYLAILKAGGAYLPLDPLWPRQRLEWTIADSGLRFVVTLRAFEHLVAGTGLRHVSLDEERDAIATLPGAPVQRDVRADDVAHIMYTSGSTGEPKGVAIPHRAVVRLVTGADAFKVSHRDVVLQIGALTFDAATFEIWTALLNGALLVVFPPGQLSVGAIGDAIQRHGVTTALLTTPLFHQMVDGNLRGLAGVRQLLTGGDVLSPDHARRALAGLPGCTLINAYGPTEGAVIACCERVEQERSFSGSTIPIGRPIANTRVYVLDGRLRLAPIGAVGELAIGGDGLARGYAGRPDVTAERFVPDPFAAEPGARMYLTGDLVRWRPDGRLEFHGRRDSQVKVRGVRIEPAEVEAALLAHPEVGSAAVAGLPDPDQGCRLVAWVSPRNAEQDPGRSEDHVERWRDLFEATYRAPAAASPECDFVGWNSSGTGEPIPQEEMIEWVEETVSRIAALGPSRVLEVGCGTGLLLLRLARQCREYLGTDFSETALERLRAHIASAGSAPGSVRLDLRTADDFGGIAGRSVDAVVLNSIVQYFPDADYLMRVIERAVEATVDGGFVFVGDVRDLSLQRAFHTWVVLQRADPAAALEEVASRARDRARRDPELLLDPAFFARLPQRLARIANVEIRPKAGRSLNELTLYRYDVFLHVGASASGDVPVAWRNRGEPEWTEARLRAELANAPEALGIRGLRDERLARDLAALDRIDRSGGRAFVAELAGELASLAPGELTLDRLREIAREHWRTLDLAWPGPGAPGRFDAVFRRAAAGAPSRLSLPGVRAAQQHDPPAPLASVPFAGLPRDELASRVRRFLVDRLPSAMVPSAIVVMPRLPLGPTGKVDRRALPRPADAPAGRQPARVAAPRDETERTLVEVWERVLGRSGIGIRDDFFDLGGHSLLGVRLLAEVEKRLGKRVPLDSFFRFSTVERMAELLRTVRDDANARDGGPHLSEEAIRDLLAATAGASLVPLAPGLAGLHRSGSRPPLFWCFNAPTLEPAALAERLGPDQPLYAMLSGANLIDWDGETAGQLANHYLPAILALQPEGPYRVGGNCAGARVAVALAGRLLERGAAIDRLCIMEHFEPALHRHRGRMLLLYGRESHLQAHRKFGWPDDGWAGRFASEPEVHLTPGAHGQFFSDPDNLGPLAERIAAFLEQP